MRPLLLALLLAPALARATTAPLPPDLLGCQAPDVLYQATPLYWKCGTPPADGKMAVHGAAIVGAHDLDTPKAAWVEPGPVMFVRPIRVDGIDSPEIAGKGIPECEKAMSRDALAWQQRWFDDHGRTVDLPDLSTDKYDRDESPVRVGDADLATDALAAGKVRPYHGERRPPGSWCTDPKPLPQAVVAGQGVR